ncbi:MAG: AAA family ATPase [Chitinophagaceae bacterium]
MAIDTSNTTLNVQPPCMVKDIQFFSTPALLKHSPSITKYRTRFEESEVNYLYWDIELLNILYRKENSTVTLKVRCTALTTRKEMYAGEQNISLRSSELSKLMIHSWGSDTGGFWKADQYLWEVSLNGKVVLSKTIIIDNFGAVTESDNPYFDVSETKCFDAGRNTKESISYLQQFKSSEATSIGVELNFKRKFVAAKNLEFILTIIEVNTGWVYAASKYDVVYPAIAAPTMAFAHFTYGTREPGYWQRGTYLFYIRFMDVVISSGQFMVGDEAVEGAVKSIDKQVLNITSNTNAEKQETAIGTALAEMKGLVGMTAVKKAIQENIDYLKFNKLRMEKGFADDGQQGMHNIFTGNPGTGKTTVVRLLGKIYKAMGLLSKGHVIETTRADLIAEYIGQTAVKTKAMIEKARGGVLFLDEVYALTRAGSSNDYGAEAIEILLKEMSDGPGDIAIIGAGYPEEVAVFLNSNPGLQSRFSRHFQFDDYLPAELMQIADIALQKEQAVLSDEARASLDKILTGLYRNRNRNFGNARLVFGIIDEAKKQMGIRLLKKENAETLSQEELCRIELTDLMKVFEEEQKSKLTLTVDEPSLDEALQEMERLTGLQQVKQSVRDKINLVRFYAETGKDSLHTYSLHAMLTGNPGTGKTTLARLLGKIYKALGLLERGHVVEVDRQNLVAGYVGQTAIKTAEAISKAMGGILFIDEAYALAGNGETDFGNEAIETLLKMMEDNRGKFAVIAAGYPDNMNVFIRSNPGLSSRFDTTYQLPDYTCEELFTIAEKQLAQQDLTMQPDAAQHVTGYLKAAYAARDKFFGNARFVRQAVDIIVTRQHLRMAALPQQQRTPEMLQQVLLADVETLVIAAPVQRPTIGFKSQNKL